MKCIHKDKGIKKVSWFARIAIVAGALSLCLLLTPAGSVRAVTTVTFTASAVGGGTISPSGTIVVPHLSYNTFTITPDPGNHIVSVLLDGTNMGAVPSLTDMIADVNHVIVANFAPDAVSNDIAATAGANGSITPVGTSVVPFGGSQSYTIAADPGFQIDSLTIDGTPIDPVSNYQFTNVIMPHTIDVTFIESSFSVVASAGIGGTISPFGTIAVPTNGNQMFSIAPSNGYVVSDVLVDGVSVGVFYAYDVGSVRANHTIAAVFSEIPVLTSVAVTPATATTTVGGVQQFAASALDQNGVALATQPIFTWTSSDPAIATIDAATGVLTAVAPGTATISATVGGGAIGLANAVVQAAAPVCQTGADTDASGSISLTELLVYIGSWKMGNVTLTSLLLGIGHWKTGVGC